MYKEPVKISSSLRTNTLMKLTPVLYVCIMFYCMYNILYPAHGNLPQSHDYLFLGLIAFVTLSFMVLFFKFRKNTMDEVWDCGHYLLVKKSGKERNILFDEIISIDYKIGKYSSKIFIELKTPNDFAKDKKLDFVPAQDVSMFGMTPPESFNDLKTRIDKARAE